MDIQEIKMYKEQAERDILETLQNLESATGLDISDLSLSHIDVSTVTDSSIKLSNVNIELFM